MVLKRHSLLRGITYVLRTRASECSDVNIGRVGARIRAYEVIPGDIVTWSRSTQPGGGGDGEFVPDQIDLHEIDWIDRHRAYAIGLVIAIAKEHDGVCYVLWSKTLRGRR